MTLLPKAVEAESGAPHDDFADVGGLLEAALSSASSPSASPVDAMDIDTPGTFPFGISANSSRSPPVSRADSPFMSPDNASQPTNSDSVVYDDLNSSAVFDSDSSSLQLRSIAPTDGDSSTDPQAMAVDDSETDLKPDLDDSFALDSVAVSLSPFSPDDSTFDDKPLSTTGTTPKGSSPRKRRLQESDRVLPRGPMEQFQPDALPARYSYTHIETNEFRSGATGKVMAEDFPCQCSYDPSCDSIDAACGDTDCVNRSLFVECTTNCPIQDDCQNMRFQKRQYAKVEVLKTEKKGFGLRTLQDLRAGQFVLEYCGEVIPQAVFVKRTAQYSKKGSKHFYFMSLKADEVIDAHTKGNLSRFINHSCNPNCQLQKWVVGARLRMGIFSTKDLAAGDELTFDYKFERYGSAAQKCYCGEPTCKGYIGVDKKDNKTMSIIDEEDDEEIIINSETHLKEFKPPKKPFKPLGGPDEVNEFIRTFLECSSKPVRLRNLLGRMEATENIAAVKQFVRLQGLLVLKSCLREFRDNLSICRHVFKIFKILPLASKNTLLDKKILDFVKDFKDYQDEEVARYASELCESWEQLPYKYVIPKRAKPLKTPDSAPGSNGASGADTPTSVNSKRSNEDLRDPSLLPKRARYEKDPLYSGDRSTRSPSAGLDKNVKPREFYRGDRNSQEWWAGSYPEDDERWKRERASPIRDHNRDIRRSSLPPSSSRQGSVPPEPSSDALPPGWAKTQDAETGNFYYYHTETKQTQWVRPTMPPSSQGTPSDPVPIPEEPKKRSLIQGVDDELIDDIVNKAQAKFEAERKAAEDLLAASTRVMTDEEKKVATKQLQHTISAIVVQVVSKFKKDLSTEKLKKKAREVTHLLIEKDTRDKDVISDIVDDSKKTKITAFAQSFMEKYVAKLKETSPSEIKSKDSTPKDDGKPEKSDRDKKREKHEKHKREKHKKEKREKLEKYEKHKLEKYEKQKRAEQAKLAAGVEVATPTILSSATLTPITASTSFTAPAPVTSN